jgi:hypothetical protein
MMPEAYEEGGTVIWSATEAVGFLTAFVPGRSK